MALEHIDAEMEAMIDSGMYRPGSKEELIIAMTESSFLYVATAGFFSWIADHYCS